MWTEDGWIEDRDFDTGSSSAYYSENYDNEEFEPKDPIGFLFPEKH